MSVTRTGGRYVRDPKTGAVAQVDGPAIRAAEATATAPAAKPAAKTKAAPPADAADKE